MRALLLSLLLISLGFPWVHAQTPELTQRIRRSAEFYRAHDGFMGVLAVQRDHHLIYEAGYGYANIEKRTPFTAKTRFPIASLSKQFTAAAILLLKQDGKLNTSDPLSRYYPKTPASWKAITLRNLLTHTSGIPDFDFGQIHESNRHRPEELLRGIRAKPVRFPPGSNVEYANANYLLLGIVIEKVSGESYCHFLRDRIFQPLQLNQTGCSWNARSVPERAHGYRPSHKGPVAFEDSDLASLDGAGSLYSTAEDLIRWTEALFEGRILWQSSLDEMSTPSLGGYGYGIQLDGEGAERDFSHTGVVDGFFALLDYLPSSKTTVVVLSNLVAEGNLSSPGTVPLDTELVHLGMFADPILPSEGREADVPEDVLRRYVGYFRSVDRAHEMGISVSLQNGRLYIKNDGGQPVQLKAESATRFYLSTQEAEVLMDSHEANSLTILNYAPIWALAFSRQSETEPSDTASQ